MPRENISFSTIREGSQKGGERNIFPGHIFLSPPSILFGTNCCRRPNVSRRGLRATFRHTRELSQARTTRKSYRGPSIIRSCIRPFRKGMFATVGMCGTCANCHNHHHIKGYRGASADKYGPTCSHPVAPIEVKIAKCRK